VSDARIVLAQARYAILVALRNPRTIVFATVFPLILLVMFNSIFTSGSSETTHFSGGTIAASAYFTAGLAAYAVALQTFTGLVVIVTTMRETGQLKRRRGTPMPAWTFMVGYPLRAVTLSGLMVIALFAIGALAYSVNVPAEAALGIAIYVLLGTAAFATLAMAATIATPTVDVASSVGPFVTVMLSFISGIFVPVSTLPDWLEQVGKVFPLYHLADGLQNAVTGSGTGLVWNDLQSLIVWGLIGLFVAARRFRWEPQSAPA
jgi:ABC-2 type transport system permease protein